MLATFPLGQILLILLRTSAQDVVDVDIIKFDLCAREITFSEISQSQRDSV